MKKMISIIMIAVLSLVLAAFTSPEKKILCVTVTNIHGGGLIRSGMYRPSDKFLKYTPIGYIADPKGQNQVTINISDLPYGEYAMVLFHDKDGNGELNQKIFGIPTEPFGFSNNVRPKMSAPKFEKCKFVYNQDNTCITIRLDDFKL